MGISGTVSNSNPNAWVAVRNANDVLYVYGQNNFTFPTFYVNNTPYNVTVAGTDPSLRCTISDNTGVISNARVTNVAVFCSSIPEPCFVNGFEIYDRALDWSNTVDDSWGSGGVSNVYGYCCGMPGPQAMNTDQESAHTGAGALLFSGRAFGNANDQVAYLKLFDLSTLNLVGGAYLSYWLFPQSQMSVFGAATGAGQSANSAVDITLSNGTAMHINPGLFDQFGNGVSPASQGNLIPDSWNFIAIDIGSISALPMENMSIGWQQEGIPGGYRGYLDDVIIDYALPPPSTNFSTSWEDFQTLPTWLNSIDAAVGVGGAAHVGGLCCGATGPQAYVTDESAHTGTHSLVYAGRGNGVRPTYAYVQILDLSHSNLIIGGLTTLNYWVYPQSQSAFASVTDGMSAQVALDIVFSDGTLLRDSGLPDSHGTPFNVAGQATSLRFDTWNLVSVPLGQLAGKIPVRIDVDWASPAGLGGYRGFIDDISIADKAPTRRGTPPTLVGIALTPDATLALGATVQLVASAIYSDGSHRILGRDATYTSDAPAVASVDANGYVSALSFGVAHMTASYGGIISSASAIVVNPAMYMLGGTVFGLLPSTHVSLINGPDHLSVTNGNFTFPTGVAVSSNFAAALTNPQGQLCVFVGNSNTGVMPAQNDSNIAVSCSPSPYLLGGTVTGLLSNTNVTLQNGNNIVSPSNGNFTFTMPVAYHTNFNVSLTNPNGQTCVFASNSNVGVMPPSNDSNVLVNCTTNSYSLGGSITGLLANTNVTLADGNDTIARPNGAYNFPTLLPFGRAYSIGITNPTGQTCAFNPNTVGNGNMGAAPVTNANVNCITNTYSLGGTVTGLLANTNVTLQNGSDSVLTSNGNFIFPTNVAYNSNFSASLTSPSGQTCSFVGNSNVGVMPASTDMNVQVTCAANPHSLGGTISGLLSNTNVTLADGNDTLSRSNGAYTFPTLLPFGRAYSIGITNPTGQTCAFNPNTVGNGNMGAAPVTNANVNCTTNTYSLGGTVTGLLANTNVTLQNGSDSVLTSNGNFIFPTNVAYNSNFSASLTSPSGQTCSFVGNSNVGVMPASTDMNVQVTCAANPHSLGGTISGLLSNTNVTLADGNDTLSRSNGAYTFPTLLPFGRAYSIGITNPTGQTCAFNPNTVGNGNMGAAPVTNANVNCTTNTYSLGGTVTGLLANTNVTLQNGADSVLTSNGNFIFPTNVAYNSNFSASLTSPSGQTCSFVGNSNVGVMPASTDMNVQVTCAANAYSLGGTISGLLSNTNVTLADGNDTLSRSNGAYTFPTLLPFGRVYNIGITNPSGQTCAFNPNTVGNGNMGAAPVTNANVNCTTNTYSLGGTVTGLLANTNVTLQNGSDSVLTSNGNFIFPTNVAYNSNFSASLTSPSGQTCSFVGNSNVGVMPASTDMNVQVTCAANTYSLGGTISGLLSNTNVTLADGNDTLSRSNGAYTFPTLLPFGRVYNIGITNPTGQTCAFNPNTVGNGNMGAAPVTNANVNCTTNTYSLGGTVTGLLANTNVTLQNGSDSVLTSNGNFIFPTNVAYNSNFSASLTSPSGQTCSFVGNSNVGVMPASTDMNVQVTCAANTYSLGGTISGLLSNTNVTLADGNDTLSRTNGAYTFPTLLPFGRVYNIGLTNPSGQTCAFNPNTVGNGNMGAAPVTNANVNCTTNTYSLGGTVTGLLANTNVTLQNGADSVLTSNGNFIFPTNVAYNSNFSASLTSPSGQTCSFVGNSNVGVMPASTDTNVQVTCSANTYSLGGTISGLLSNTNVTLSDANDTLSHTNGAYTFPTLLPFGRAYSIGLTNPSGQTCAFNPNTVGNGNMGSAPVTNANVVCSVNTYPLGGHVTGLVTGNVTLTNTVNADVISVGNGNYLFDQNVAYAGNYNVIVASPNGLACVVPQGNATMAVGGNFNVAVTCTPTPSTRLVLSGYATPRVAGQNGNINITAYDASNNVAIGYTGTVHLTTSDPNAMFSPNFTFVAGYAGSANVPIVMTTAGTQSIRGNDIANPNVAGVQTAVLVNPNVASYYQLSGYPNPTTDCTAANVTVAAYDIYNNLATGYTGTVHLHSTDANALLGGNFTFAAGNSGSASLPVTLKSTGAWAISANDTSAPAIAGAQSGIVVNAGAASSLSVSGFPSPVAAGTQGNVTIAAYDACGNIATGYLGQMHLTSTDGNAILAPDFNFVVANHGIAAAAVTFRTSGLQTINANDTAASGVAGNQNNITVTAGSPNRLVVLGPTTATAGVAISPNILVIDAFGNVAASYTGTVHITSSDTNPNTMMPANHTFTGTDAGQYVYSNGAVLLTAGTTTLTATDVNSTVAIGQGSVTVVAASAAGLVMSASPNSVVAGTAVTLIVQAVDAYGNPNAPYTGTVYLASTDIMASFVQNPITFATSNNGSVTLPADIVMRTSGVRTISAQDGSTATFVANANVTVSPNVVWQAVFGPPTIVNSTATFSTTLSITDAYGNLNPNYVGTMTITSTDPNGTPFSTTPNSIVFAASDAGTKTLPTCRLPTVGYQTVTANDSTLHISGAHNITSNAKLAISPNSQNANIIFGAATFTSGSTAVNSNTFHGQGSAYITPKGAMYMPDSGHNRVLGFNALPTVNGASADFVMGQTDFVSSGATCSQSGISGPWNVSGDPNYGLLVTDGSNNRILIFKTFPTATGALPDTVVGSTSFTTCSSACSASGLNSPIAVKFVPDYNVLLVSDYGNNRLLVFPALTDMRGVSATMVLGQPNLRTCTSPSVTASSMGPRDIWTDNTRLFVGDNLQHRVLIFNSLPTLLQNGVNNPNADVVLLQTSFTTNAVGCSSTLIEPSQNGITSDGVSLFLADGGNDRVIIWDTLPVTSSVAINRVIGNSSINTCSAGSGQNTLGQVKGVTIFKNRLVVPDQNNYRFLIFNG